MPSATDKHTSMLRQAGLKATLPRLRILELLERMDRGIDVHEIYVSLLEQDRTASLSTVYATLKQLSVAGVVDVHLGAGRRSLFSLDKGSNLAVCTCIVCGKTTHIDSPELADCIASCVDVPGRHLKCFKLDVRIVCETCARARNS